VLAWLTAQNTRRRRVEYSVGWSIGEPERAAIIALPSLAWSAALAADGGIRDGAQVAELTGLLALPGWPAGMRVIVRREAQRATRADDRGPTVHRSLGGQHDLTIRPQDHNPGGTRTAARQPSPPRPGTQTR
jgi:hypothetical protein